jgi:hypothetical protein
MNEGLWVVIGMSIAYLASFLGMIFAWIHYKKRKKGLIQPEEQLSKEE